MSVLLELGPGTVPHPRTSIGLDLHHPIASLPMDATREKWPVANESVDEIYASHFMEHVAKGEPILHVMSEGLRVLKPGGTFTMVMPLIGWTDGGDLGHLVDRWEPYADPTHVQFWWFPESLLYFCEGPFKPNADYGMAVFDALGPQLDAANSSWILEVHRAAPDSYGSFWTVRDGWEGVARLKKKN